MRHALLAALLLLAAAPARATFTLSVSTAGPVGSSGTVISDPAGINCPGTCSAAFVEGSTVTLTETVLSTVAFTSWAGTDGCKTNSPTCAVPMTAAKSVRAQFSPMLGLAMYGNGLGEISDSTPSVKCTRTTGCGPGLIKNVIYPTGSVIVLTATAAANSTFTGWTGDVGCTNASTCTITLNGYEVITATFSSTGPFTIAVNVYGSGVVVSSPTGITCPGTTCSASFSSGTLVTFTTSAAAGYYFAGWANGGCSGLTPCVVTSSNALQGLGGAYSPSAFFYRSR